MSKTTKKLTISPKEWGKTFQLISWWDKEKVQNAKVMVVGAGALGNEVLKNLALLGVGNILIVDFDKIEYSNLSRSVLYREEDCDSFKAVVAADRVREINPKVKVKVILGDIMLDVGLGTFNRMDVVIGCLDNRLARIYINRHCFKVGKIWIDGALENLAGQISVYQPLKSCYECQVLPQEWEFIRFKLGCPDIARRNAMQGRIPTTPISASIIGAMQAQEALKVVHNNHNHLMKNEKFYYEGMSKTTLWLQNAPLKDDCQSHYYYDSIETAENLSASMSLEECLDKLMEVYKTDQIKIELDYQIALELSLESGSKNIAVCIPQPHLSDEILSKYEDNESGKLVISKSAYHLDRYFPYQKKSLSSLGIPKLHIIRVLVQSDEKYVELSGDKDFFSFD